MIKPAIKFTVLFAFVMELVPLNVEAQTSHSQAQTANTPVPPQNQNDQQAQGKDISQVIDEPTPYVEGTVQTFDVLDEGEDLPEE